MLAHRIDVHAHYAGAALSPPRPGAARTRAGLHAVARAEARPRTDRPTGQVNRSYERERPGKLIHVDIKKLGNMLMCQLSCVVAP